MMKLSGSRNSYLDYMVPVEQSAKGSLNEGHLPGDIYQTYGNPTRKFQSQFPVNVDTEADSAPGPQAFENLLNNIDPSRLVENRIFNDNPGFLKLLTGMGGMGMMG